MQGSFGTKRSLHWLLSQAMSEYRRVLVDGYPTLTQRHGDELIAGDGRRVQLAEAVHSCTCRTAEDHLHTPQLSQQGRRVHDETPRRSHLFSQAGNLRCAGTAPMSFGPTAANGSITKAR